LLSLIPIITVQSPFKWEYKVIGMATAQSVTWTVFFTEFASAFTDLMGGQSKKYSAKLEHAENLCSTQLRLKAYELGGNAVVATDLDYTEVGGIKEC
jgi:uncharacterized protein YbjQ (UPF0145 family)